MSIEFFSDIAGLHETVQTCVTQPETGPVTWGIAVKKNLNRMLTCVIHYDELTPVYWLYAAMNNEQCNRVHLDSGIWEPDEPEKNNEVPY